VLSRIEMPDAFTLIARDVWSLGLSPPGVIGMEPISRGFAQVWHEITGQQYRAGMAMRIYQLTAVTPVTGVPGTLRLATVSDRDLLVAWMAASIRGTHRRWPPG
jgi:predicted GNAT family acetyltransferase